jgi:LCP family protein required for cell wall assembly
VGARDIFINGSTPPKINSLLDQGAAAQISGIESLLGISIDHYVRVRFIGFERIVDALGGVRIDVPYPARDLKSGVDIPLPGCTTFDGTRALAWVRSRSLQYYVQGAWRSPDPVPDIGRIGRQAQLLQAIAAKGRRTLNVHPGAVLRLTDTALRYVQVDSGLGRDAIVAMARTLLGLAPGSLGTATVPWKTVDIPPGGEQGLALDTGAAFSPSRYLLHGSGAPAPASSETDCR